MSGEFEKAIEALSGSVLPESPFVAVNSTHYCEGFSTREEAERHVEECRMLRLRRACCINGRGTCQVCIAAEAVKTFPEILSPCAQKASFPFGSFKGEINQKVKVVVPL